MVKSVVESSSLLAHYWDRNRTRFPDMLADNDPLALLGGFVKYIPLDSPRVEKYAGALQLLQEQLPDGEQRTELQTALKPYVENLGVTAVEALTVVQQVDFSE
jgi:hypothetical protein